MSSDAPRALIEIRGLVKEYRSRSLVSPGHLCRAIAGVDLSITAGSTLAIVGQSGSGKSTLARCIARLDEPSRGEIWFDGVDIASAGGALLRSVRGAIQLVLQDAGASLNPRFTAQQIVEEPLRILGLARGAGRAARVRELLSKVRLDPAWSGRRAEEFSGGQRRRLAIARALASHPRVVLLDEALAGLDRPLQMRLMGLLRELQRENNLTCLFISHDLALASRFASDIAVMYEGRIVDRAAVQDLARAARHPHTLELIAAQPGWPGPRVAAR
jgi:ABC-type glutathione transport system ATPase component